MLLLCSTVDRVGAKRGSSETCVWRPHLHEGAVFRAVFGFSGTKGAFGGFHASETETHEPDGPNRGLSHNGGKPMSLC